MKRLRVLSVINTLYYGGAECRLFSLSKRIDKHRFEHTVLTLKRTDPEREKSLGTLRPQFAGANIPVETLGEVAPQREAAHGSAAKVARSVPRLTGTLYKLVRYINAHHIDVIDAHVGTANQLGTAAAVLSHRPVVTTTYGLERFQPLWLWNISEAATLSAASAIVTDSEAVAGEIREKLLRPRPIAVIPNGIEVPYSERRKDDIRAEFGIPLDPRVRVIGQIGSLTPRKGHLTLLDAARELMRTDPYVHLLICGFARAPFDYARIVRTRAMELGLDRRVHFVGYPGPIADVFRAIDIQVHASTEESLPQAIIEGMALGKPAVVTAIAGVPSMVTNGVTGILAPPDNVGAIVAGVRKLLSDPAYAQRLGRAAQERYARRYTDMQMTRDLEDLFIDVAQRRLA